MPAKFCTEGECDSSRHGFEDFEEVSESYYIVAHNDTASVGTLENKNCTKDIKLLFLRNIYLSIKGIL